MTEISVTADKVGPIFPGIAEIYSGVGGEAITAGQTVKQDSAGLLVAAIATGDVWGIALNGAGAGQAVSVLVRGHLEGADVAGMDPHAAIYTGAGGTLDDAGTVEVGQVIAMSDSAATKVAFIG